MFSGLFDIDWGSLGHAYGSAEDVPPILLGLVSDDPGEREMALDRFHMGVHHQGDVYDSTVACLPFLFELIADSGRPDRGPIVELISSIGEPLPPPMPLDDNPEEDEWRAPYVEARALICARAEEFVPLLADYDAAVRRASAAAVAAFVPDSLRVVGLLQERLEIEPEIECRLALVEAAADVAMHDSDAAGRVADWLIGIIAGDADPGTRLAALVHLARSAPDDRVDDLGTRAVALLREIREHPGYVSAPPDDRPPTSTSTPTLTGAVRAMFAAEREGRTDAWTGRLLRVLNDALAERVADRITIVKDQLRQPDPGRRIDALRLSSQMMRGWRGPYEYLVELIGHQLGAPEQQVRSMAALALRDMYDLAAPADDALAEQIAAAGPDAWTSSDRTIREPHRNMVLVLARLGDARVVPVLDAALADGSDTSGTAMLAQSLEGLRAYAHRLAPTLSARLGTIPSTLDASHRERAQTLLMAAGQLSAVEVLPEVHRVLEAAMRSRQWPIVGAALRALKSFGPAANDTLPRVRELTSHDDFHLALLAIESCWAIEPEAATLIPLLRTRLGDGAPGAAGLAAKVAGSLGPQAEPLADRIRALMDSPELWTRVRSSIALAKVAGEAESVMPVLSAAWQENPHVRVDIAGFVKEFGSAAESFLPLLRAESANPRRHTYRPNSSTSDEVGKDEQLLKLCAEAVDRIT